MGGLRLPASCGWNRAGEHRAGPDDQVGRAGLERTFLHSTAEGAAARLPARGRTRATRLLATLGLAALALAARPATAAPDHLSVAGGALAGSTLGDVVAFKDIPYAAAPVGALRWRPPEPAPAWSGTRDATAFGPVCPQPIMAWANGETGNQSEDCLRLNIWAPAGSQSGLPVMVWFHGGAYTAGAGSQSTYDGAALARKGAVIVSVNYRLGVLGFLAHPQLSAEAPTHSSGNYGLLDQIAALKWVRANIARFGGDPANVTIFGESAGGGSVLLLTTSPEARGLFAKAIVESGAALGLPGGPQPTLAAAEQAGAALAAELGATDLARLRALPVARLIGADAPRLATAPIIDGHVVREDVTAAYRAGRDLNVPLLIGWNSAEGAMFANARSAADYEAGVRKAEGPLADTLLRLYPADGGASAADVQAQEMADTVFGWRALSIAQARAGEGRAPTYVYWFDTPPPRRADSPYHAAGAMHSEELGFVWGSPAQAGWPVADRSISAAMQDHWIAFALTGNPDVDSLPHWQPFGRSGTVQRFSQGQERAGPVPRLAELRALDAALEGPPAQR